MFFRVKSAGSYQYVQIVHSVREGEKVRQQVFGTLGRLDQLKASGQLEALIRSGLRHCEKFALIDAHAAGETQAVTVQRIGPDLVFRRLWKECAIQEIIQSLLKARRYDFEVERAIYLTVLHRLFASGSDRAAERWREDYLIAGTEELDLHHLYRAMVFLGQEVEPRGQKTLGAPRCLKDLIEEELFERRRDLFTEVDLVFFDTTSLYFEGRGGESIGLLFIDNKVAASFHLEIATIAFVTDQAFVKAEERYDGLWVLRTNTVYNAETVAHVYRALWTVEDIFRTSKSILETRPIYHKRDETIRGHVFCSFLALVLKQELESRLKQADLEWEWKEVIRGPDGLQQVEANFQGRQFLFRSQLTAHASQAVRATGVAIPPTLRELQ
jgi:hypothetical protein